MKRSLTVPLIFLGTLGGLTACGDEPPANTEVQVKQDFYASLGMVCITPATARVDA